MGYLVRSLPQRVPIPARPQGKSAQHGRCIPIHFDRPSGGAEEMGKDHRIPSTERLSFISKRKVRKIAIHRIGKRTANTEYPLLCHY